MRRPRVQLTIGQVMEFVALAALILALARINVWAAICCVVQRGSFLWRARRFAARFERLGRKPTEREIWAVYWPAAFIDLGLGILVASVAMVAFCR